MEDESVYVEQIGGEHYQKDYQHWTWATDDNIPYLLAVATKYIDRWRTKNGIQDLQKSITFLKKAEKMFIEGYYGSSNMDKFVSGISNEEDRDIIIRIISVDTNGDYSGSILLIEQLIEKYDGAEEAGAGYVNQDGDCDRDWL